MSSAFGPWSEDVLGFRALEREQRIGAAGVVRLDPSEGVGVPLDPGKIFVGVRGIDDKQEVFGVEAIDEQVINDAALLVGQGGILHLIVIELGHIVGRQLLEQREGVIPDDFDFAHMRNVEETGSLAYRHMFGDRSAILHGHLPAGKVNHATA
jgi:hypothetical protein